MNIEARIRALEAKLHISSITLVMSDGSERRIPGDDLPTIMCDSMSIAWGERTGTPLPESRYADVIALVRESVSDNCASTGNGELINMIRVLCSGPVDCKDE